ncbi:MAG: iron ABC transporter permease [Calditrichae bacterium]|nr:iron ABC transporter permease [Calditrichota bacterium]MCB9089396.1 iron ABC transporter permease [Calditrichia bacterium]
MRNSRRKWILLGCLLLLAAVLVFTPLAGSQPLDYRQVLAYLSGEQTPDGLIFFRIRLPRIFLGVLTGASLAVAGVVFQALLRNPLATPYTLGVASGSALGALLVIKSGLYFSFLGFSSVQLAAFAGSLLTVLLVYAISRRAGRISIYGMILAGVTISFFFSALILILHYLADFTETQQMIRWTMGGLDIVEYGVLLRTLPLLLVSFLVLWGMSSTFNILSTSEETALSKGVDVPRVQILAFVIASLLTGSVVALSGPIGFVGLIIPHLLRLLGGPDHRYLIPASILLGGGFLALSDTLARTLFAPVDLPVGIITTLLGGPFFLWLLIQKRS